MVVLTYSRAAFAKYAKATIESARTGCGG